MNVGVLGGDARDGFAPEDAVFEDVGLVDGGEFFSAALGGAEGDVRDAFDFAFAVHHGVDGDGFAIFLMGALGLSEVEASGEFANAEHIKSAGDEGFFDGRRVGELGVAEGGPKVCEESEMLSEGEKSGSFGLLVWGEGFPLGAADGSEQDGVRVFADFEGLLGECFSVDVDGDTSDAGLRGFEREAELCAGEFENAEGFGHDFRSDSVTGENSDFEGRHKGGDCSTGVRGCEGGCEGGRRDDPSSWPIGFTPGVRASRAVLSPVRRGAWRFYCFNGGGRGRGAFRCRR